MSDLHEQSIFSQALDRDAGDCGAFLDGACASDPALRARVERLLHHHEHAANFLAEPAVGSREPRADPDTDAERPLREGPGAAIGPYKLLEQIGEGGMGVVFLAEQTRPVRRQVALKVIKAGMDTRHVVTRFEAERQALAIMDHPHIAKVFDGGMTDSGRPYFVMELVKGEPITEHCDRNQLPTRQRLELFAQVCHAVQHAHQKGIIHRDIKPTNVLVSMHDTTPVVKVIDFGVAKALGATLTEKTLYTGFAQLLGTPLYMSPEQAGQSSLDVDTRSDVYSLGVLLYELLTGTTPFDKERFKQAAQDEIRRIIREEEPPKPSARLSGSKATLASVSAQRHVEPAKLTKLVRGELDWIVMKALEKDRSRRYATATGVARDVERYLRDEPVEACPPSTLYRFRKFVRRNKAPVVAAALVLLTLVAGIVGTTWQAVRAEQARQAEARRAEGERQAKQKAQQRHSETKAVLDFVEKRVFAAAQPEGHEGGLGHDVTLRRAVEAALPFVDNSFKDQPLIEARLRSTMGFSFWNLGEAKIAAEQFSKARALRAEHLGPDHPETLASMGNVAASYYGLGRHDDALKLYEEVLAVRRAKLGPDHPDTLASMGNVAASYNGLGRHAEALPLTEEALALTRAKFGPGDPITLTNMLNLASTYSELERHADAFKLHQESVERSKATYGPDHPETLASMNGLANSYHALGRYADAITLREETVALMKDKLGAEHYETLMSIGNLTASYAAVGRDADALRLMEETFPLMKGKLGPDHPQTLVAMHNLARDLVRANRGAEGILLLDECFRRVEGKGLESMFIDMIKLRRSHFRKGKDASGCRTTAEMWERLNCTDSASLYNAACNRAITAAVVKDDPKTPGADASRLAREEADRAMAWLHKAVAAGFSDVALVERDTNLDTLRERADFKTLLAVLKAKQRDHE